jgi:hypothetical protein
MVGDGFSVWDAAINPALTMDFLESAGREEEVEYATRRA